MKDIECFQDIDKMLKESYNVAKFLKQCYCTDVQRSLAAKHPQKVLQFVDNLLTNSNLKYFSHSKDCQRHLYQIKALFW